jgi:predicted dehydrogenase
MVEHFADVVLGNADLMYPVADSIGNMRVLDALTQAAHTGETIKL